MKIAVVCFAALFCSNIFAADAKLNTDDKKISYAIGTKIGNDFKRGGLSIDVEALSMAISDVLGGKILRLDEQEIATAMEMLNKQQMQKQVAVSSENKKKGEDFLAANKSKPGVKVLASGIQYKVIKAGSGKSPTKANSVVAHYRGTLIDGTEFDSSFSRGKPATFPVTGVIKGWQEVLQLMKTGSKWQVYIPSDLAYGQRGTGPTIGPNSTLIFDIELIEIK